MQCSGCFGTNFQNCDGKFVCEDCGEEVIGVQQELMDEGFIGTSLSNRPSQLSQAQDVRATVEARQERRQHSPLLVSSTTEQMYVFEAMFHVVKAITDRLIRLQYVTETIRSPIFQIVSHLIRRMHAGEPSKRASYRSSRAVHMLATIALAASHVRSVLLPRDLCRIVATQQVPYLTALTTTVPEHLARNEGVQILLAPHSLPTMRAIVHAARDIALGPHAWPPLREIYGFPQSDSAVHHFSFAKVGPSRYSFPVGHAGLTLLRLTRLLGLPDDFGARVIRWIELRKTAMKDYLSSYVKASNRNRTKNYLGVYPRRALLGRATDESLLIDIVNTMRLCYGRRRGHEREPQLEDEWLRCKATMTVWLKTGCVEDIDSVQWTSLSPNILATIRGKRLRRYARLVDIVMEQKGERRPELWGPFLKEFKDIANQKYMSNDSYSETDNESGSGDDDDPFLRKEKRCMYDGSRCAHFNSTSPGEGEVAMDQECGYDKKTDTGGLRKVLMRPVRRRQILKREKGWTGNKVEILSDKTGQETVCFATVEEDVINVSDINSRYQKKRGRNFDGNNKSKGEKDCILHIDSSSEPESVDDHFDRNRIFEDDEDGAVIGDETQDREKTEANKPRFARTSEQFWKNKRWVIWGSDGTSPRKYGRECGMQEWNLLWEPVGIGLALTIMLQFIDGCNVDIKGMECDNTPWSKLRLEEIKGACNRTMRITMNYAHDQLVNSEHFNENTAI